MYAQQLLPPFWNNPTVAAHGANRTSQAVERQGTRPARDFFRCGSRCVNLGTDLPAGQAELENGPCGSLVRTMTGHEPVSTAGHMTMQC